MDQRQRRRGKGERIFAVLIGLVFVGQFGLAWSYPSDPRLFPLIVACAGVLLMLVVLAQSNGKQAASEHEAAEHAADARPADARPAEDRRRMRLALLSPPLFALALWALGFWIVSIVTIPLLSWQLGYRNRLVIALVTAGVVLAVGLLFPLVNVALPRSALFGRYLPF